MNNTTGKTLVTMLLIAFLLVLFVSATLISFGSRVTTTEEPAETTPAPNQFDEYGRPTSEKTTTTLSSTSTLAIRRSGRSNLSWHHL